MIHGRQFALVVEFLVQGDEHHLFQFQPRPLGHPFQLIEDKRRVTLDRLDALAGIAQHFLPGRGLLEEGVIDLLVQEGVDGRLEVLAVASAAFPGLAGNHGQFVVRHLGDWLLPHGSTGRLLQVRRASQATATGQLDEITPRVCWTHQRFLLGLPPS
jgi:hypothetical protein